MPNAERIIFIDDEAAMRQAVTQWLGLAGYDLNVFDSAERALEHIDANFGGAIVTDLKMFGIDGMELLRRAVQIDPELPVVLITGHGDVETAVEAMRLGAYDFIEKPFVPERLLEVMRRACEKRALVMENRRLRRGASEKSLGSRIIGTSAAAQQLRDSVADLAGMDVSLVIYGETGTGKDLVARCLHDFGLRQKGNFVAINCAALPETLAESELFGHEAGAFTHAAKSRTGKLEHASGGTLFLDEIDSMPIAVQGKLLRALQERSIERLGSNRSTPVDIRPIAASKLDLRAASESGSFRRDLYYRLSVVELVIPPLRERSEDIPLLFEYFVRLAADTHGRQPRDVGGATVSALLAHHWPGNIRELRNAAERYALGLSDSSLLRPAEQERAQEPLANQLDAFERAIIERCLAESGGRMNIVIEKLGVPRRTLNEKMARLGIDRRRIADTDRRNSAPESGQ